jgi:hypothetical protein
MSRMAFSIKTSAISFDLLVGFSWGAGGVENTAIFAASEVALVSPLWVATRAPVDVPGGFPGLVGNRIFLDIMGSVTGTNNVYFDFKIYDGRRLLYETPTVSAPVYGLAGSLTINTGSPIRGGIVGSDSSRQFIAGILNLVTPDDIPRSQPAEDPERMQRFNECMDRARYLGGLGRGAPLGGAIRCWMDHGS